MAKRVDQKKQFHQIVVGRGAGRLDNETVGAAHVFLDADKRFAVGKRGDIALAQLHAHGFANGAGKRFVGGTAKYFHELNKLVQDKTQKPPLPAVEKIQPTL